MIGWAPLKNFKKKLIWKHISDNNKKIRLIIRTYFSLIKTGKNWLNLEWISSVELEDFREALHALIEEFRNIH